MLALFDFVTIILDLGFGYVLGRLDNGRKHVNLYVKEFLIRCAVHDMVQFDPLSKKSFLI